MANVGLNTKEVAAKFNMTGKQLRRILRSFERYADGKYTRYVLGKRDIEQIAKHVKPAEPKKSKKAKPAAKPPAKPPVTEPTTDQPTQ